MFQNLGPHSEGVGTVGLLIYWNIVEDSSVSGDVARRETDAVLMES